MIICEALGKRCGHFTVVDNISFALVDSFGQWLAVAGAFAP